MVDLLAPARATVHSCILGAGVGEGHAADSRSTAPEASPDTLGVCAEETRSVEEENQQVPRQYDIAMALAGLRGSIGILHPYCP